MFMHQSLAPCSSPCRISSSIIARGWPANKSDSLIFAVLYNDGPVVQKSAAIEQEECVGCCNCRGKRRESLVAVRVIVEMRTAITCPAIRPPMTRICTSPRSRARKSENSANNSASVMRRSRFFRHNVLDGILATNVE